jgi:hypothetical protein
MSIITVDQLNEYSNNYDDSTIKTIYIGTAEDIVKEYLGYNPASATYTDVLSGVGDYRLFLKAQPVTEITLLTIDGVLQNTSLFTKDVDSIYKTDYEAVFTEGQNNIQITYKAGYTSFPGLIQMTVLRIATLLMQESNGNIGITGKSFDTNSRSFINYSDFNKYLKPLDPLRIIRI